MKGWAHLLAAAPLTYGLAVGTGAPSWALAGGAASVLMDLDHLPDYVWWRVGWRGLADFFDSFHAHQVGRILIPLHSWELLPAALLGLGALGWPVWGLCLGAGWLYHLLWDLFTNPTTFRFYLFWYRARRGFLRSNLERSGAVRRP